MRRATGPVTGDLAWREAFEERAGILEFEARVPRAEAEARARSMVDAELLAVPLSNRQNRRTDMYRGARWTTT